MSKKSKDHITIKLDMDDVVVFVTMTKQQQKVWTGDFHIPYFTIMSFCNE